MRVFFCDHHRVPLPKGHPFPMEKYGLLREELVRSGVLAAEELEPAPAAPIEALLAVHEAAYVEAVLARTLDAAAVKRVGFPWSEGLVARTLASVGGTLAATEAALAGGSADGRRFAIAGNLAGGTHHAHAGFGSGYCVFNDVAVAAVRALERGDVRRVLVLDLDVHQGDGTAALFAADERVFTVSLHGARNFPARKERSDLDVALPDRTGDEPYLAALREALGRALELAHPDLAFVQGGVDPLATDRLGRLSLTHAGLEARDRLALTTLHRYAIPIVLTLGGGYARPIEDTVRAHVATYRVAKELERGG